MANHKSEYELIKLLWRHNEHDGVSKHQRFDGLLNRLFRRRPKKTSQLRVTGLCEGNSPEIGEFPSQRASNAENASIWWRHHAMTSHSTPSWVIYGVSSVSNLLLRRKNNSAIARLNRMLRRGNNIKSPEIRNTFSCAGVIMNFGSRDRKRCLAANKRSAPCALITLQYIQYIMHLV